VMAGKVPVMCGVDIGGTLAKTVVYIPDGWGRGDGGGATNEIQAALGRQGWTEEDLRVEVEGGCLVFFKFVSSAALATTKLIEKLGLLPKGSQLHVTGGGAFKYKHVFEDALGVAPCVHDEMESLVRGLTVLRNFKHECFSLKNILFQGATGADRESIQAVWTDLDVEKGFLIVNIGSGVSFVHCTKNRKNGKETFERIGGSSLGGSTFLGLTALLTGVDRFDDAIDLAANGDSAAVDMLVKDIYGDKQVYNLKPTTLASSFGKMVSKRARKKAAPEDLALSTLIMCSMNVAALAHLHAKSKNAKHVVFTGSFLTGNGSNSIRQETNKFGLNSHSERHLHRRNRIAMRTLAYALAFWTKGEKQAIFLKHDGFLGAVGSLSLGVGDIIGQPNSSSSRL